MTIERNLPMELIVTTLALLGIAAVIAIVAFIFWFALQELGK
jgi:hypothetical protein